MKKTLTKQEEQEQRDNMRLDITSAFVFPPLLMFIYQLAFVDPTIKRITWDSWLVYFVATVIAFGLVYLNYKPKNK